MRVIISYTPAGPVAQFTPMACHVEAGDLHRHLLGRAGRRRWCRPRRRRRRRSRAACRRRPARAASRSQLQLVGLAKGLEQERVDPGSDQRLALLAKCSDDGLELRLGAGSRASGRWGPPSPPRRRACPAASRARAHTSLVDLANTRPRSRGAPAESDWRQRCWSRGRRSPLRRSSGAPTAPPRAATSSARRSRRCRDFPSRTATCPWHRRTPDHPRAAPTGKPRDAPLLALT